MRRNRHVGEPIPLRVQLERIQETLDNLMLVAGYNALIEAKVLMLLKKKLILVQQLAKANKCKDL